MSSVKSTQSRSVNRSAIGGRKGRWHPVTSAHEEAGYEFVTQRWLRTLHYSGRLPLSVIGGKAFVDLDDVDALMEANRRDAR